MDKFQNKFYRALTESDGLAKLPPYVRLGARGNDRKNMRQVPEIHRARPDLNNKVENVRSTGNTRPLSVVDVEDIMRRYHIIVYCQYLRVNSLRRYYQHPIYVRMDHVDST